jgi:hypothetical protein
MMRTHLPLNVRWISLGIFVPIGRWPDERLAGGDLAPAYATKPPL